jgi:hypothetical protein
LKNLIISAINWIKTWDLMAILYSLLASIIFALALKWTGFFRWLYQRYIYRRALGSYRKQLSKKCSSLIVIGRRHGFAMKDVFIELDLAQSDLMDSSDESIIRPQKSFVLVGAPGAGKTTMCKKFILDRVANPTSPMPFFIQLREYDKSSSIEEFIIDQLKTHELPAPEVFLRDQLRNPRALCVLDGLDEVRPNTRDAICENINQFYKRFFVGDDCGDLIVTCRKEAYRHIPLDIPTIREVRPFTDEQIMRSAKNWPLGYPNGKNEESFWRDLISSPRILELARSPLLLMGGLMQYTESNLGIPEDRVEYLARIGKWLVSDWAIAQGHPTDPYRSVYSRLLTKLAFEIHKSQRAECSFDEATDMIETWLPLYGYPRTEARNVLDSIMTKTGILVRDVPGYVIFAQFGLQEYYASIDAIDQLGVKEFVTQTPRNWWREIILLAIAQEKEPGPLLMALFEEDSLLAAAGVAECPTPAIAFQEMAIKACLEGVDQCNEAARSPAVSLLRKVKAQQEECFVSELEKRLIGVSNISTIVGLILAAADTPVATSVLMRHPVVWETCLKTAGFLSNSLERLILVLITDGDEQQSKHAAELIAPRLSADMFRELSELLPSLSSARAEHLATLLLKHIERDIKDIFSFHKEGVLHSVSKCVPYILDLDKFFSQKSQLFSNYRTGSKLIPSSICLSQQNRKADRNRIYRMLTNSLLWTSNQKGLLCLIASSTILIGAACHSSICHFYLLISCVCYLLGVRMTSFAPPWEFMPSMTNITIAGILIPVVIFFSGSQFILTFGAQLGFPIETKNFFKNDIILSIMYLITGLIYLRLSWGSVLRIKLPFILRVIPFLWLFVIGLDTIIFYFFSPLFGRVLLSGFALLFCTCFTVYYIYLFFHWIKVRKATYLMMKKLW